MRGKNVVRFMLKRCNDYDNPCVKTMFDLC